MMDESPSPATNRHAALPFKPELWFYYRGFALLVPAQTYQPRRQSLELVMDLRKLCDDMIVSGYSAVLFESNGAFLQGEGLTLSCFPISTTPGLTAYLNSTCSHSPLSS
jgi:hypothetical protein